MALYCLIKTAAYLLINTVCIFHDFLFIINVSYAAIRLYSGLGWNRCSVHTTFCAMCDKIFHAWLRFARHFDAWFYRLYLHPIFTIEEFLDKKLICILKVCQSCPFIIILIITIVCSVYVYFIYFFFLFPDVSLFDCCKVLSLKGNDTSVMSSGKKCGNVSAFCGSNWFECLKQIYWSNRNKQIEKVS